ncbi:hypothetical protein [Lewinella sp. JB7]|uniref:hypothetical protein n=1 Tax=Lewinella sp. JB7 TaxID=2962887 RepID=UPI0020C97C56|nr:hypothetical protein [Lewinella sp. JB7]MCP9235036.1 hypothetical protein [Lewinella sp. JB7]
MKHWSVLLLLWLPALVGAQSYDAALGIRIGTEWGATAQLRLPQIHKNFVVESIISSSIGTDEGTVTLLGKQHQPLLSRRLNLFYGAGLHAGWNNEIDTETGETFNGPKGLTGIVGLEATVGKVNLSYDFKPALNVSGGSSVLNTQTAVSVRYVIGKRNSLWNKDKEREIKKRRRDKQREKRREERERAGKRWFQVWKKG